MERPDVPSVVGIQPFLALTGGVTQLSDAAVFRLPYVTEERC